MVAQLHMLPAFVVVILLGCLAVSCHRENDTDRLLADIEQKLYVNAAYADSARLLVDSISSESTLTQRGEVLKTLILTGADIWFKTETDSDSAISYAVDYFRDAGDENMVMRAKITRGYVRIHTGKLDDAMYDALDALQYATSDNDSVGMAKTELLLADIYREAYRSDLSILHREKSLAVWRKLGFENQLFWGTQNAVIAWDYHHCGNNERSIAICDSLLTSGQFTDLAAVSFIRQILMCPYVATGQYDKAKQQFDSIRGYYLNGQKMSMNWYIVIKMFMEMNQPDSARRYLEILKDNYGATDGNWHYHEFSHLMDAESGNYENAYYNLMAARNIMDSRSFKTKNVSPEDVERDYNAMIANDIQHKEIMSRRVIVCLTILLLVIVVGGMFIHSRIKIKQKLELEENLFRINELQKLIEQKTALDTELEDVAKLMIRPLKILSAEYSVHADGRDEDSSKKLDNVVKEMENLRTEEYLDRIVAVADVMYGGGLMRLEKDFQFKRSEIYLLALRLMEFPPKSICWFLRIKPAAYYTRWKRLRRKITENSSSVGQSLLAKIENTGI